MGAYSDRIIADGASNYWRLGEPSGTSAIDVVGGKTGTISGGVTLGVTGALSDGTSAMAFNGTTGKVVTVATVTIPATATIECWVKRIVDGTFHPLLALGVSQTPSFYIDVSGVLAFFDTPVGLVVTVAVLPVDIWTHVAFVTTGTTAAFYINGVLASPQGYVRSAPETFIAHLGEDPAFGGAPNGYLNGSLDEVAIYPRALSATEISAHYALGRGAAPPRGYRERVLFDGASNYWRLSDPSGTTAVDSVGGANGTISGGVTLNQPGALSDGNTAMSFGGVDGKILTVAPVSVPLVCTIEAWTKFPASGVGQRKFVVTRALVGATGDVVGVGMDSQGGANYILSAELAVGVGNVTGTRVMTLNAWHHTVYVLDGATVSFYLDGVFDRTQPFVRTTPSGGPMQFGFDPGVFAYIGAIDDIAIYPRALTAAEVAAHYLAGKSSLTWPGFPSWVQIQGEKALESYNVWTPITPSDTVDLPRGLTGGIWVGGSGDLAVVMQNNVMPVVIAAVPTGAWLPLAAKRINATLTTATNLVALYEI